MTPPVPGRRPVAVRLGRGRTRALLDLSDLDWFCAFHPRRTGVPVVVGAIGARLFAQGPGRGIRVQAVCWSDEDLRYRLVEQEDALAFLTGQVSRCPPQPSAGAVTFTPDDVLCLLGSWWSVPGLSLGIGQARRAGAHVLSYVHDLAPLLDSAAEEGGLRTAFGAYLTTHDLAVDRVAFISEATRRRWLAERGAHAAERGVHTAAWQAGRGTGLACRFAGADPAPDRGATAPEALGWPRPFILMVSALHPWKRQHDVVALWGRLVAELGEDCPDLLLVGQSADGGPVAQALAAIGPAAARVHLLGPVSDERLATLYRRTLGSLFLAPMPDGWGLPVTEALTFGRPVIAADTPALRESGGGWAIYVPPAPQAFDPGPPDPSDPAQAALAAAVRSLIVDERSRERRARRIRSGYRALTWAEVTSWVLGEIGATARSRLPRTSAAQPAWVPAPGEELPLRVGQHLPLTGVPSSRPAEVRARMWVAAHRDQWVPGGLALLPGRSLQVQVPGPAEWPGRRGPVAVTISTVPTGGTAVVALTDDAGTREQELAHGEPLHLSSGVREDSGFVTVRCLTSAVAGAPGTDSALFCSSLMLTLPGEPG